MIVFGVRMFGKVDEVPGLFHVATQCAHVWFIPLFPVGSSMVVLGQSGKKIQGVSIPLSAKSMLTAWARGGLIVGAFVSLAPFFKELEKPTPNVGIMLGFLALSVVCAGLAIASWKIAAIRRASYERAVAIADKIGLSAEGHVRLELAFERVTAEEAQATLLELARDAAQIAELQKSAAEDQVLNAPRGREATSDVKLPESFRKA